VDGAAHRGVEDQGFAVDPTGIWVVSASMMTWGPASSPGSVVLGRAAEDGQHRP